MNGHMVADNLSHRHANKPAHVSLIKKQTGKLSKIQIYMRNKSWSGGGRGRRAHTLFYIFSALYFTKSLQLKLVISESRWGSPTESPTASSVSHLSLWYSLLFDSLLVPFRSLKFSTPASSPSPPPPPTTNRQLLRECLLKWLHKWISKDYGCSSGLFWLNGTNSQLLNSPGSTATRTICLIDAVKSENCYDMKFPIQIGRKLWLIQSFEDNNVRVHLTYFNFWPGPSWSSVIPNY